MVITLLASVLLLLITGSSAYRMGDVVPMGWRYEPGEPWKMQTANGCPQFRRATSLVMPRPIDSSKVRKMEFVFGRERLATSRILVYHPQTLQVVRRIEFTLVYDGDALKEVKFQATYAKMASEQNHFRTSLVYQWEQHGEHDAHAGMQFLLLSAFLVCVILFIVVLVDEYLRFGRFGGAQLPGPKPQPVEMKSLKGE